MAHYAWFDENNIVQGVFVGKNENEPLPEGYTSWEQYYGAKRTSYNTYGGVHKEGGTAFRKNYAGVGFTYDEAKDAFIPPKPFNSWTLDNATCLWQAPTPMPTDDKNYEWSEDDLTWKEVE